MLISSSLVELPAVQTVTDCADFSLTIAPYLPQLRQLPQQIFEQVSDADALRALYVSTNPAITALSFALFLTPVVLVVSEFNCNYSQVDRLWSLLPAIYNVHYTLWAHMAGLPAQKLDHIMAITTLWSVGFPSCARADPNIDYSSQIRLTFNYWRKGGYSIGSEDYRWEALKPVLGPTLMFIFNVLFISLAQNV
jgi:steroid 5-alpha reductase family enzyme